MMMVVCNLQLTCNSKSALCANQLEIIQRDLEIDVFLGTC
jgi:hypothetical protein